MIVNPDDGETILDWDWPAAQGCDDLLAPIEAEPKTKDWQKRAKKGTDKIWYNQNFSDW